MDKKLSVIIPTVNRAKLLRQTLSSIELQTMDQKDFEIIVIDNGSTDYTKKVCEKYQKKNRNLRYIYDARPGLHIGRNRGCLESKTDILVYADDDIIASDTWLETIYEGFKDPETVLIGGNNYPYFETKPPKWVKSLLIYNKKENAKRLESFSVIAIGNESRKVDPGLIFGCNFAIRKKIVIEAKGFHPDGVPDKFLKFRGDGESYITRYIRYKNMKAMFYPKASVYHVVTKERMTKGYIKKIAYRTGISFGYSALRKQETGLEYIKCLKQVMVNFYLAIRQLDRSNIESIRNFYKWKGYLYIVVQFGINKKVRNWIKKDNYFDAAIPK